MADAGVDSAAVEELGKLEILQSGFPQGFVLLQQELKFMMRFMVCQFWCEGKGNTVSNTVATLEGVLKEAGMISGSIYDEKDLVSLVPSLLNNFKQLEPKIRQICAAFLDSFKSISCSIDEILGFIDCLVQNFQDLANLEAGVSVQLKDQILVHHKKLFFLGSLIHFSGRTCIDHERLGHLLDFVKDWVHSSASLSLFCLLKGKEEGTLEQGLEAAFSDLLQQKEFMLSTPEVMRMFIGLLRASKSSRFDKFHVGEVVVMLVDFLLEGFATDPLKDYVEILKDGLIFMMTYVVDPPTTEEAVSDAAGDGLIRLRIDVVVDEVLSLIFSLCIDGFKVVDISILQANIDEIKAVIRELFYFPVLNSLDFNFPMTNGMGCVNYLLENMEAMVQSSCNTFAFAKDQVMMILAKLNSFKLFLMDILEVQKVRNDLKYLWRQIIKLVFLAKHVLSSCLVIDRPIWYDILQLSDVVLAIKLLEIKVKRHNEHQMYKLLITSCEENSSHVPMGKMNLSSLQDVTVDLKDESKKIIEKLNRGTKGLHIVSIVGMPGLGKTTMAQKVYSDSSIRYSFRKRAWCCVSQVYNRRELYFDMLTDVFGVDARQSYSGSTDDDLAEMLWRSLKKQKFLIVLDDIWNIEAWDCIKGSFPDDKNGSRIIITSRIQNLISPDKIVNCSVHPLRSLSDEESWELMKGKLSRIHSSPLNEELSAIGKKIANNCKGLPLTIILVSGFLADKDKEFWKQIECRSSSKVVSEGCMDAIDLSYKHLPDHLKPCFLYFGAFPEDRVVKAQKLMNLWIAEGLIPKIHNRKISLYEVAKDYLSDLISRSLVIPVDRSSQGGIKSCRVHDLIHDLCSLKAHEDNFLQLVHNSNEIASYSSSKPRKDENVYRLFIHAANWREFVDSKPTGPFVHSLVHIGYSDIVKIRFSCPRIVFNSFRFLNVLDLEETVIDGPFPEEVTLMIHLRYLAISFRAAEIPPSIANLWNLEIFIGLTKWFVDCYLPRTFWSIKSLRRVCFPHFLYLPHDFEHYEYGELENLEIFSAPHLQTGIATNKLLKMFPRLRKFKCFVDHTSDHKFPELCLLTHLESLNVMSGDRQSSCRKCEFTAFDFPSSLKKLTLHHFFLPWSAISPIEQLPNLEVLKLKFFAFSGRRWEVKDGTFLELKYLKLSRLYIENWTVQDDPFPSLEHLIVDDCPELCEIPSGLGYIPTLKKIELYKCARASGSARKVLEEQREMGNDFLEVVIHEDEDSENTSVILKDDEHCEESSEEFSEEHNDD